MLVVTLQSSRPIIFQYPDTVANRTEFFFHQSPCMKETKEGICHLSPNYPSEGGRFGVIQGLL